MITALEISPATILSHYIIDVLESFTSPEDKTDWPLFVSHMPDEINDVGCVYNTSPIIDGKLMCGDVIEHPGIQITIRTNDYEIGRNKAEILALALDVLYNQLVTVEEKAFIVQNARRMTGITDLGLEIGTKRRYLFTIDYVLTMKRIDY
jgi:hypothetical protein